MYLAIGSIYGYTFSHNQYFINKQKSVVYEWNDLNKYPPKITVHKISYWIFVLIKYTIF